jgi:beta-phosphoglucomutase-like phosphatase (HAD superfamily)
MANGTTVWQKALDKGFSLSDIEIARTKRNEYYQNFLKTENILINGVKEILHELSKDYKMAIITTSRRVDPTSA